MAAKKPASAPLTFDLRKSLLAKIDSYQKKAGIRSKSEVIRDAIEAYDFGEFRREEEAHSQISVRLPVTQKRELSKLARQKKVSLGELLRAALESLPENPPAKAEGSQAAATVAPAKAKKPAAKGSAKKAAGAKKASSKAAAVAPKPSAKKAATAKKGPVKKAVAKKAPSVKSTGAKKGAKRKK